MPTADFAYIDDAVSAAVQQELDRPTVVRDGLKVKATRVIAGFHIHDPKEEERLVEEAVEARRKQIGAFQNDREVAMTECATRGIVPLAVVPVDSWRNLCVASELFRLSPTAEGRVGFHYRAFVGFNGDRKTTGEAQTEWFAKNHWVPFLKLLFPNYESVQYGQSAQPPQQVGFNTLQQPQAAIAMAQAQGHSVYEATLVMPVPPAAIAQILMKAVDIPNLKVAAVAGAIAFKETPSELYSHVRSAEEAIARALREDPIVYFERGSAAAIICQFGDFPIEIETVRRVVSAENLMRFFPGNVSQRSTL